MAKSASRASQSAPATSSSRRTPLVQSLTLNARMRRVARAPSRARSRTSLSGSVGQQSLQIQHKARKYRENRKERRAEEATAPAAGDIWRVRWLMWASAAVAGGDAATFTAPTRLHRLEARTAASCEREAKSERAPDGWSASCSLRWPRWVPLLRLMRRPLALYSRCQPRSI